jgi:hypothetical protein
MNFCAVVRGPLTLMLSPMPLSRDTDGIQRDLFPGHHDYTFSTTALLFREDDVQ